MPSQVEPAGPMRRARYAGKAVVCASLAAVAALWVLTAAVGGASCPSGSFGRRPRRQRLRVERGEKLAIDNRHAVTATDREEHGLADRDLHLARLRLAAF